MERPYNGTPLSWFQRYYYYQGVAESALHYSNHHRHRDQLYTSSGSIPDFLEDPDHDENDNGHANKPCTNFCEALCAALCCLFRCGCCCKYPHVDTTTTISRRTTTNSETEPLSDLRRSDSFSRYKASSAFCLVFVLTIVIPMTLLHASRGDCTWLLHPGESRRIRPAFMNRGITVSSSGGKFDVQVYATNGKCPPLSGPRQNVSVVENLTLAEEIFEYHFFYLNQGSTIHAQIAASLGSADVYLLRGQQFLYQLEKKSSYDPGSSQYIRKQTATPGQRIQWNETINVTDTYTLVFDNPKKYNASMFVSLELQLSTYNLHRVSPKCSKTQEHPCTVSVPMWLPWEKQCLLVQTSLPTANELGINDAASVHIAQHRRFGWIVTISLLPLLAYSFWPRCYQEEEEDHSNNRPYEELYQAAAFPTAVLHDFPNSTMEAFPTSIPPPRLPLSSSEVEESRPYLANVTNSDAVFAYSYQQSLPNLRELRKKTMNEEPTITT